MYAVPALPLDTSAKEIVDFCLEFRTVAGFVAVFEQTWTEKYNCDIDLMGTAYEETEIIYNHLFGRRRYNDREVFYSARSRHYKNTR